MRNITPTPDYQFLCIPGTNEILLDKQDILQRFHISDRTLQRWRTNGTIPFIKIGGKIYYRLADVMRLLEEKWYYRAN